MRSAAAQPRVRARAAGLMLAPLAIVAAACGSSSETLTAPAQARCAIGTEAATTSFSPDGGAGTLRVSTERECTWTARSDAAWIALGSPSSGQGDGTVPFTVAANEAPDVRQAAITVNDHRQAISQQGRPCEFEVSPEHQSLPAAGGERTVEVDASSELCRWTAVSDANWIAIVAGSDGTGDGTVTFRVAAATGPQRRGTIRVADETVQVDQGTGCAFALSPSAFDVGPDGGDLVVRVDTAGAECAWTTSTDVPWITMPGNSAGTGSGTISLRVAATAGPQRTGTVTVAGQTIRVTQGTGCNVALEPASAALPAGGGTASIDVRSGDGCPWTAASGEAWIGVSSGAQGSGSGRVEVTVAANAGPARSGAVTIGGRAFAITQASGCSYAVAPTAQDVAGTGASSTITVSTAPGCPWTTETRADWLSLSAAAGAGPDTVRVTWAPNNSPSRNGTVLVAGQAVTISQASLCTYTFAPPFHEFGPDGGSGNVLVIVSGPCTWTAKSGAAWIQVTAGSSGAGGGLVQFAVSSNPGAPRTGFITIAGEQYRVVQAGK